MGNFFDSGVKEKFIEHLKSIDENSKPLWGVMNAAQMIKHLDITYKTTFKYKFWKVGHDKTNAMVKKNGNC